MKRYMALGAALAALGAGGAALGQSAAAGGAAAAQLDGGLSLSPALFVKNAQPGSLGTMLVANRSAAALTVTVTPRPWVQSANGRVSANRRGNLPGVSVSEPTFTLAPGAEKQVGVTLDAAPAGGSLYGAVEVVGIPADIASRQGVVLGYRLIGTIRVLPDQPRVSLVPASRAKITKRTRTAVLEVRNAGNVLDPVTGSARVRSSRGTRNLSVDSVRVLPGNKIAVPLGSRLARGSYVATVRLSQQGKTRVNVTRRFTIR
jgi:hypothetical protein